MCNSEDRDISLICHGIQPRARAPLICRAGCNEGMGPSRADILRSWVEDDPPVQRGLYATTLDGSGHDFVQICGKSIGPM